MGPPERLALRVAVDALADELGGPGWMAALAEVAAELRAARDAAENIVARADAGEPLATEVRAWAERLGAEASVGLAAARLVQQCHPVATLDAAGRGRAVAIDATGVLEHAFGLAFQWAGLRGACNHVVFGPRFAVYPSIVAVAAGVPALDAAAAIVEDANAVDHLCRLALAVADDWRTGRASRAPGVRAFVGGDARPVDEAGDFDTGGARVVLLRDGAAATRVQPGVELPFRDPRLA